MSSSSRALPALVPPEPIDFSPLNLYPLDLISLCFTRPEPDAARRFTQEGLLTPAEIQSIENGFNTFGKCMFGTGIVVPLLWTTYLLRGGVGGVWTKKRQGGALAFGVLVFGSIGLKAGYELGALVGGDRIWKDIPQNTALKVLTYKYLHSVLDPSKLPAPGSTLFDKRGQPTFATRANPLLGYEHLKVDQANSVGTEEPGVASAVTGRFIGAWNRVFGDGAQDKVSQEKSWNEGEGNP